MYNLRRLSERVQQAPCLWQQLTPPGSSDISGKSVTRPEFPYLEMNSTAILQSSKPKSDSFSIFLV
jgi:hypothetical protein